jgi:ribosomal protein RSM22 (predicted rRNA methylase)
VRLPDALARAIEEEVASVPSRDVAAARERLTDRYREGAPPRALAAADRAAYLASRAPATYAAARAVFAECAARSGGRPVASLLDVGAGPGVAAWAALDAFPTLARVAFLERDAGWVGVGRRLAAASSSAALAAGGWTTAALETTAFPPHDAVVLSYALGEVAADARPGAVARAYDAAGVWLAIVEPGTPRGFETVRAARSALVGRGATVLAPCTHEARCPMSGDAWCRFATRLERTEGHRRAKRAARGFEDEPYAYVVAAKVPRSGPAARIVAPPERPRGHVVLDLCTREGLRRVTVARSDGSRYRAARAATWGTPW